MDSGNRLARVRLALDDVCRVAARALRSDMVCIASCSGVKNAMVIGAVGTNSGLLLGNNAIPGLEVQGIVSVTDVKGAKWYPGHALQVMAPFAKRLLAARLDVESGGERFYLVAFDPRTALMRDISVLASMAEIARIAASFLAQSQDVLQAMAQPGKPGGMQAGFLEGEASVPVQHGQAIEHADPLVAFLMRSLIVKRTLRVRGKVTFITLRTWRVAAKATQIDALQTIKEAPNAASLRPLVREICDSVDNIYAGIDFQAVVPMPRGHSKADPCLSELLAMEVAAAMGVPFIAALKGKSVPGKSHPKQSYSMSSYKVDQPVAGPVLLIDDVATTGIHMEKAVTALRGHGASPFGIAWIGG